MGYENLIKTICIIFLFSLVGCAPNSHQGNRNGFSNKSNIEFQIIINDEKIHGLENSDKFINALKKELKSNFKNTVLRTGYDTPKINEIIISPQNFSTNLIGIAFQGGAGSSLEATTQVIFSTYKWKKSIDFSAMGVYMPNHVELLGTFILGFATLTAYYHAQKAAHTAIVLGRAIDSLSEDVVAEMRSSSQFSEYFHETKFLLTDPSQIRMNLIFSDQLSLLPNQSIDAAEKSTIIAQVINQGKGTAFDVEIQAKTKFKGIRLPSKIHVGNVAPGEKKEVKIPVSANISIETGTATIMLIAREKRGYDSRPIKMKIKTAKLERPELQVSSYELNDSSGLSQGDGDFQLENNETIELISLVENNGAGPGLGVVVGLKDISDGIEIVKAEDDLATIGKNDQHEAKLAFKIPRTYSKPTIDYTLYVSDVRGIKTEKTYSIPFVSSTPILGISYQVFDDNGKQVSGLENGKSYLLKVTPTNEGNNPAEGVHLSLHTSAAKVKIGHFDGFVGMLSSNRVKRIVTIPFSLDRSYISSALDIVAELKQDDFSGLSKTITLPVVAHSPNLEYETALLNGISQQEVMQNSYPKFRVSVRNNGDLDAENVTIHFKVSHPTISFEKTEHIGRVTSGGAQYRDFSFFVRGDTDLSDLSIVARINQEDFSGIEKHLTVHVVPQTVIVQTVAAIGTGKLSSAATYSQPPQISINFPNDQDETYSKIIKFKGNILLSGIGNGIGKVSVTVNGQPVQIIPYIENIRPKAGRLTKQRVGNKILLEGQIALDPDSNRIEIKCVDWNNQDQTEVVNVVRKARLGDIYAVVVGVSQFSNRDLDLNYAATDAQKFYDFLKTDMGGKVSPDRMKLLVNNQASRASVTKALTRFLGMAKPEDTVEIYLATHGYIDYDGTLYYLTHDSEMENLLGTALSSVDFENIIRKKIQADRVIIYIDTCKAGQAGQSDLYVRGGGLGEVNQANSRLAARLSNFERGVATFMATSAQGYSYEAQQWDGGVYTYHLLKGLKGDANDNGDEWVSIGELAHYLTSEVYADTSGKQRPNMDTRLPDDTPVAQVH